MGNFVFVQIFCECIKFAMHKRVADFGSCLQNLVLKRFCNLTCQADILMLQILNAIERKKGQVKTSVQRVRKGNSKLVMWYSTYCVFKQAQFCSTPTNLLRHDFWFTEVIKQEHRSFSLVIQDMLLDFVWQNETLHVDGLGFAWQLNYHSREGVGIWSRESTPARGRLRNTWT